MGKSNKLAGLINNTVRPPEPLLCLLFLLFPLLGYCQLRLPRLVSDGMVLQREAPAKLWGWAAPGEKVVLTFRQQQFSAVTAPDSSWSITLPPQKAGGPYEMTLEASNRIRLQNILFGDVWVCSGQSNMELTMQRVQDTYPHLVAGADNPHIRQFEVPDRYQFAGPRQDLQAGSWYAVTPETIFSFSAVAYFFARDLYAQYQVPIGLINAALGGSPAEAWMSAEAVKEFPHHYREAQRFKDPALIAQIEKENIETRNNWYAQLNQKDEGLKQHWHAGKLNTADWAQMDIPGDWADTPLGAVNGAVWFRKEVEVPKELLDKPARLLLGRIVDADSVFINGHFVGTTSYQYPPRKYPVPFRLLKEGKNVISVRVLNQSGRGGFVPDKPYVLVSGTDSLDLTGAWSYRLGATMEPLPAEVVVRWKPTGLYNAMIAPLLPYTIKGVIWYQGESNTAHPQEYEALMKTLIGDWRQQWQQGSFPFIQVQLANFMEARPEPEESNWAALRQAQRKVLSVPATGMAVAIDAGEWNDIHPLNKEVIGKRLALQARKLAYGDKKVVASGPTVSGVRREGNTLMITFSNVGSGLVSVGGELKEFAIAGPDKKYVWARAQVKGNQVVVWHEDVQHPVSVRYAWADNPEEANLYNKEGLPASPFEAAIQQKK